VSNLTTAKGMVAAIEAAIEGNPLTLVVRMPDGTSVTYASLEDRRRWYHYWTRRLAQLRGTRPPLLSIDLSATV